ncbi:hypothetical protein D9611_004801 [Ephemerocybe angulata]|uniref:Zn(2)-C6 fungal-type domain-containing protein n=1 Tax=Ephemerocybe angulata TaxID=980116 RepID=A0A8H5B3U2_9AGAR|nr:hypothetical protein D9611_004801 [Tulosesus angulatus]
MANIISVATADELRKQGLYFDTAKDSNAEGDTSPTISPTTPPNTRPRIAQACDKCRERKTKCSGEKPTCVRCSGRGLLCHYSVRAHRMAKTKTTSPVPRKRERAHKVDPPGPAEQTTPTQPVAKSANAYKPYPYPPPPRKLSSPPQPSSLTLEAPRPQMAYPKPRRPSYNDLSPAIPNVPLPSSMASDPAAYNYRAVPGPSHERNDAGQYLDCARGPPDSFAGPNAQWWTSPYGTTSKSLSSASMRLPDELQLGGSLARRVPEPLNIPRSSYSNGSGSISNLGSQSLGFYDNRGQHISGFYNGSDTRTASYDSPFSSSSDFMDFPNSFTSTTTSHHSTSTTSSSCPPHYSPPLPQPVMQPQQPLPQRPLNFEYPSSLSLLDFEDRRYSDYY